MTLLAALLLAAQAAQDAADSGSAAVVHIPTWALGVLVPVCMTIAGSLFVLAFRSGALIEGLKHIGSQLKEHADKIDGHAETLSDHAARITAIESVDEDRQARRGR